MFEDMVIWFKVPGNKAVGADGVTPKMAVFHNGPDGWAHHEDINLPSAEMAVEAVKAIRNAWKAAQAK